MNSKWPTLPNGSVDWVTVFQHPETGLMVNVERADTPEKLKACMHVVLHALFSRDSDASVRRTFLASTNEMFTGKGTTLEAKKAKMNLLLTRIMYDREDRARAYAELQAKEKDPQEEQRLEEDDPLQALDVIKKET